MISAAQCRMARAALRWSLLVLAERAQVGAATVNRFEVGGRQPTRATLAAIRRAFEAAGVAFPDGRTVTAPTDD